ncbi:MAG: Mrp/NBP35 family ATP-binding protein [Ruminococcaceae bacterium]|nr:Mrp/NBP35 family ATP-binding protein [Oscillospiraceae bacterium]
MSENCTHDCSTCSENCSSRDPKFLLEKLNPASSVKKVYGIVSGKGGVGKSLVTSMLASAMNKKNNRVGILDADLTGPSIPKVFGIKEKVYADERGLIPAKSKDGVEVMSVNLILQNETDPVVWRGPVIAGTVKQFWTDVIWEDIDFMFIDMPPGTGDVPLTVFQSIPVDGIIIVTSPQELVSMIVEKAVNMARMMDIPIYGIVENMSYFVCSDCGKKHYIYGESHIDEIAQKFGIENVAKLPINPEIAKKCDAGELESLDVSFLDKFVENM